MGQDAGTPPGLWERIRKMIQEELAKFARSGFLRNASISDGGLTIKGGFLRLLAKVTGGVELFYIGPTGGVLGNGEQQQVLWISRADGTTALRLWDAFPGVDGTLNQALSWLDRSANVVFADDTDSGQGLARPYLSVPFYRARNGDWPTVTSTSFETVYRGRTPKHQPQLYVRVWGVATVAGGVGEIRLMVNGVQMGATATAPAGTVNIFTFGPAPVAGTNMQALNIEVQARLASGTGGVQVGMDWAQGQQS